MLRKFFSGWSTWQWLLLGALTASGIFLLIRNLKKGAIVKLPSEAPEMLVFHLKNWLSGEGYDVALVPYIIALSALESGRWKSDLWSYFNNPWGMKNPSERKTTSIGATPGIGNVPEGFAVYLGTTQAAQDFVLYLKARNSPKSFRTFYDFIAWIQSKGYEPELSTWEYFSRCLNAVA